MELVPDVVQKRQLQTSTACRYLDKLRERALRSMSNLKTPTCIWQESALSWIYQCHHCRLLQRDAAYELASAQKSAARQAVVPEARWIRAKQSQSIDKNVHKATGLPARIAEQHADHD